ncbi:MAG TPA: hypothetical protein VFP22_02860 [Candidatus Limnocylindrales bacterium]|nr:hypothetical protein [Candidatus Limnocylindrales bacterium]
MTQNPMTEQPLTMTNDEAQDWLLGLLNATPPPRDAARFGAAIRAIRAKAIADAKEWYGLHESDARATAPAGLDEAVEHFIAWQYRQNPTTDAEWLAELREATNARDWKAINDLILNRPARAKAPAGLREEVAEAVDALADALNGWDRGEEPRPDTHRHWQTILDALHRATAPAGLREAARAAANLTCIRMFWGAARPCPEYDDGRELCATCQCRAALAASGEDR